VFTRMTITKTCRWRYIRTDKAGIANDIERMFGSFSRVCVNAKTSSPAP